MKILSLDLGDQWTGSALSDQLGILASPQETIPTKELEKQLAKIIEKHGIQEIVIGYPLTLKGTESDQTKKTIHIKQQLEKKFPKIRFVLWDERLTSKQAGMLKKAKTKEEKIKSHSYAAALILDSYLQYVKT